MKIKTEGFSTECLKGYIITEKVLELVKSFTKKDNRKNHLLLEYPEAKLHPLKQIKIMSKIVELANDDNFIITIITHSDYMFDKLNNLILNKDIDYKKINCYSVEKEDIFLLDIDELGVESENFVQASELLYNEKLEIIDKFNGDK